MIRNRHDCTTSALSKQKNIIEHVPLTDDQTEATKLSQATRSAQYTNTSCIHAKGRRARLCDAGEAANTLKTKPQLRFIFDRLLPQPQNLGVNVISQI
jgi:hypothetical protein